MSSLPMIDVSPLLGSAPSSGPAFQAVVAELDRACAETGFFVISDHGLAEPLTAAFEQARAFFALDEERKERIPRLPSFGFVPDRRLAIDRDRLVGNTEYLDLGLGPDLGLGSVPASEIGGSWPTGFVAAMGRYQNASMGVASALLRAIGCALDVGPTFFADRMQDPECKLRLLHYRPDPSDDGGASIPTAAHTDYGAITLLATDGRPGLQLRPRGGDWTPIEAPAGGLVVNLGDMLARWTNLRYASTPHRVVAPTDPSTGLPAERYSIPLFVNPDPATRIDCIPTCVSASNPCRHEPVSAGQFLAGRIDKTIPEPYLDSLR